jgi:hypothetical protein
MIKQKKKNNNNDIRVTLLLSPIKDRNDTQVLLNEQQQTNWEEQNEVLVQVYKPITDKHHPSGKSKYCKGLFADGNIRLCKGLAAWVADGSKCSNVHLLDWCVSSWGEYPQKEIGQYHTPHKQCLQTDHNRYRMISDAMTKSVEVRHMMHHVLYEFNIFQHIPCIGILLPMSEFLNTMLIRMLHHLQNWIFNLIKKQKRLKEYNAIWWFVPVYHNLVSTNQAYEAVSQWIGKEIKQMSHCLVELYPSLGEAEALLSIEYLIVQFSTCRHWDNSTCINNQSYDVGFAGH